MVEEFLVRRFLIKPPARSWQWQQRDRKAEIVEESGVDRTVSRSTGDTDRANHNGTSARISGFLQRVCVTYRCKYVGFGRYFVPERGRQGSEGNWVRQLNAPQSGSKLSPHKIRIPGTRVVGN